MINDKKFLEIINTTPLVAIDLIIEDYEGKILLGKRLNRPAQGYWFVPGGRIRKNEKISDAFTRISRTELGTTLSLHNAHLLGVFEHLYDDNYLGDKEITTHYVVLAYNIASHGGSTIVTDNQHSEVKWWSIKNLLDSADVHQNTKAYFLNN